MKGKTYEAAVKLSTGEVVVYHNINTGLYKFHRFLKEKFSNEQRWLYYKVRRKETKEIVGFYKNAIPTKKIDLIRLYLKPKPNKTNTGYFIPITYIRNEFEIVRNIFISASQIESVGDNFIVIPKWLFRKAIEQGKEDLYKYYIDHQHKIELSDIKLGKILFDNQTKEIAGQVEEFPELNFP